jgi:alkyl hydroperoxide reductase subunit D
MSALEELRQSLPDAARDIKLNLAAVLEGGSLTPAQRWGVAVASAITTGHHDLRDAVVAEAVAAGVTPAVLDDARAAAALMAMNNVYYRFRHLVGKPSYGELPARLRMNRLARPATSRTEFELYSLAVSAINACESCVRAHERAVLEGGLGEEQVNDAVRIAATIAATAVALELGEGTAAAPLAAAG